MIALAPGEAGASQSTSMAVGPAAVALRFRGASGIPVATVVAFSYAGGPRVLSEYSALTS